MYSYVGGYLLIPYSKEPNDLVEWRVELRGGRIRGNGVLRRTKKSKRQIGQTRAIEGWKSKKGKLKGRSGRR